MDNQNNQPTNQQSPDPVAVTPIKAPETQKNRTKQKWSLKKLLLVIAGSIIIFILALVAIVNISTSAPVKVSDELVAAIQSNDSTAAYKLLSDDAKATISSDDLKTVVAQVSPILTGKPDLQSKEIKSGTSGSNTANVIYEIEGNDNITYKFTVNLIETNGNWKVLNFESEKMYSATNIKNK